MEFIGTLSGILIFFVVTNLLFCLLYLLSYTAGNGFYKWLTMNNSLMDLLAFPLLGPTKYTGDKLFNKFNGLIARLWLIGYAILLIILIILLGYVFGATL
ncbi:hypothetical protein ACFQPF_17425 [Fictibacillus iocasae]|uniref:Uncharacterized protein n=1 Tax=Fictibacillus iocasae TaxID=2715437 RepID=A0ABW2NVL9_9BACL